MSLPTGLQRVTIEVSGRIVESRARAFRNALEAQAPERYLRHAQSLYNWLVLPLETILETRDIQTLVFVPDGTLRSIPPAAFHDGDQYLIEKYAVAITPGLTLTDPRPLAIDSTKVLAAGITQATQGFPALPHVYDELQQILELYDGTLLLDQDFTSTRLDATLQQEPFDIVHIASHGFFPPEVTESFVLTAENKLTMIQLANILSGVSFYGRPVELLTLSACETALGNDQSALGLAGLAIWAGARSALASLWQVEDQATAILMHAFYHALRTGLSRAQALRQAQLKLLKEPQFATPYFWSPFLLINNWL